MAHYIEVLLELYIIDFSEEALLDLGELLNPDLFDNKRNT
jgi:hypothetical protein